MSAKPPSRLAPHAEPSAEPAARDKQGSLRWVRDVLGRSMGVERAPAPGAPAEASLLIQQRAELGARLLVHDPATQAVRNLFIVHDRLRSGGWPAVEALPLKIVGRALTEAEILDCDEPSPLMASIIVSLRELKDAADARAADEAMRREWETMEVPEVSETNYDEYELMERSWVGTVPAGLDLTDRGA